MIYITSVPLIGTLLWSLSALCFRSAVKLVYPWKTLQIKMFQGCLCYIFIFLFGFWCSGFVYQFPKFLFLSFQFSSSHPLVAIPSFVSSIQPFFFADKKLSYADIQSIIRLGHHLSVSNLIRWPNYWLLLAWRYRRTD